VCPFASAPDPRSSGATTRALSDTGVPVYSGCGTDDLDQHTDWTLDQVAGPIADPFRLRAPFLDAAGKLDESHRHRLEREAQILKLFRAGRREPGEMVPEIYPDLPPAVRPLAERQVRAHLARLAELDLL